MEVAEVEAVVVEAEKIPRHSTITEVSSAIVGTI